MGSPKILLIVEGAKIDYNLMERVLKQYEIANSHEIVSYNTNIYALYDSMFKDTDPSEFDLLAHLKSRESESVRREILEQRFSDILLIFDLDPQDDKFSPQKIIKMNDYFVESTDMGKLYINYPMVEAFYHMKSVPDPKFKSYFTMISELERKTYKTRVNRESRNRDYSKFAISKEECDIIILQNICKAWSLLDSCYSYDHKEVALPDLSSVLGKQLSIMQTEKFVYVLCTCIFHVVEFNPKLVDINSYNEYT